LATKKKTDTEHAPEISVDKQTLEQTLIDVVADLTGYPVQTIQLEMNIESDLGIDSIKRVEILSTLEERLPDLPEISPERIGELKTLSQIIDHLLENAGQPSAHTKATVESDPVGLLTLTNEETPESVSIAELDRGLIEVVSELTGYPLETLNLDMNIESDLGIDSIKRVEILSSLEERFPNLATFAPEEMGTLTTLRQIVERLQPNTESGGEHPSPYPTKIIQFVETSAAIERSILVASTRQLIPVSATPALADKPIYVTEDDTGLSQQVVQAFEARGVSARLLSKTADVLPQEVSFGGLVIISPTEDILNQHEIGRLFQLARAFVQQLPPKGSTPAPLFATVSRLDGQFGLSGQKLSAPLSGALAGLAKTARHEWPQVRCQALDVPLGWAPDAAAHALVVTLLDYDLGDLTEVGLSPELPQGKCHVPELTPAPMSTTEAFGQAPPFAENDVVLISGGARGITGACVAHLAGQSCARFLVLGRSPVPEAEPDWLAHRHTPSAMKAAILEHEFAAQTPSPADLEKTYRRWAVNREIKTFLDRCASLQGRVEYYCVDVRDRQALAGTILSVRNRIGPITALIHAAGVIEDRSIADKSLDQFERVFATKVEGLSNLLSETRTDPLRRIVLFSSVSARFGNPGQADYAMANEALNKIAQAEASSRTNCQVVSLNWGPWQGGMVDESLQRQFRQSGVSLIPIETGVKLFARELINDDPEAVEVVIGGMLATPQHQTQNEAVSIETTTEALALAFDREVDLKNHPVLGSHVIDGTPVVPFALMTEWLCQSALHENPGLSVHGIDDIRLLKGIQLNKKSRHVRLLAGKAQRDGTHYKVPVEIRDGYQDGREVIHSRGRAILGELNVPAPAFEIPAKLQRSSYAKSTEEIYHSVLFHGDHLKGIRSIRCLNEHGIVAEVATAPPPQEWIVDPVRSQWIADPMALDAAFQIASLWCFEQHGMVSLPSYAGKYRQYHGFPKEGLLVVLEIEAVSRNRVTADITFLAQNGQVVAHIDHFEAVMDPSLNRAFKPERHLSALN
jgi:NAD(P)-dependent dehydrogenase (short-subunit alcohol dehydrogenase family)/acyl carrier protein